LNFRTGALSKYQGGTTGIITTVAGNGGYGYSGDGGPATSAALYNPWGIAIDSAGNLYIADSDNNRIRKVNTAGVITTVAGTGNYQYNGDNIQATSANLQTPQYVTTDSQDILYIADTNNQRIRKVNTSGIISTVAGNGTNGFSGDGGQSTSAQLNYPRGMFIDSANNLYIADMYSSVIRKVDAYGIITTIAGNTTTGFSGDGGQATSAQLYYPFDVTKDSAGNIYILDSYNSSVRKVNTSGVITTIAGIGSTGNGNGNGVQATSATLSYPKGIAIDSANNLYIADSGNGRIRRIQNSPWTQVSSFVVR